MRYLKMTKKNNHAYSAKWSPIIATTDFTIIPHILIRNQARLGITDAEMVILILLSSHKFDQRHPFPSVPTLSGYIGKTPNAVRGNLKNLQKKGYIKRIYRPNKSSQYDLRPLIKILEGYAQPTKKLVPTIHKLDTPHYQNIDTKENEANKNKRRRPRGYSGKPEPIGQIVRKRLNYEQ